MKELVDVADRAMPWNGLGVDVQGMTNADQIRRAADLDWEVDRVPVFAQVGGNFDNVKDAFRLVENRAAIVRTDTGAPLGVAGNYFRPIQNADADWLAQGLIDAGLFQPVRAGSIQGGTRTFHVGRMGDRWNVGGIDPMETFFAIWNRHDGRGALTAAVLTVRIGCRNQLPGVVSGIASGSLARRKSTNRKRLFQWTIRHTTHVKNRMEEVQTAITNAAEAREQMEALATALVLRPFTVDDMAKVAEGLFPTKGKVGPRTLTKNLARQEELVAVYKGSDNLNDVRDTAWGGWNAVAEWADHMTAFRGTKISTREESRFLSISDPHGTANALKVKAFAKVAQVVGVGSAN
jgi:phage/plasmid-like protein (TIGR03299 family)